MSCAASCHHLNFNEHFGLNRFSHNLEHERRPHIAKDSPRTFTYEDFPAGRPTVTSWRHPADFCRKTPDDFGDEVYRNSNHGKSLVRGRGAGLACAGAPIGGEVP